MKREKRGFLDQLELKEEKGNQDHQVPLALKEIEENQVLLVLLVSEGKKENKVILVKTERREIEDTQDLQWEDQLDLKGLLALEDYLALKVVMDLTDKEDLKDCLDLLVDPESQEIQGVKEHQGLKALKENREFQGHRGQEDRRDCREIEEFLELWEEREIKDTQYPVNLEKMVHLEETELQDREGLGDQSVHPEYQGIVKLESQVVQEIRVVKEIRVFQAEME